MVFCEELLAGKHLQAGAGQRTDGLKENGQVVGRQCDQIGRFLKFFDSNFLTKVALIGNSLGFCEKHCVVNKTASTEAPFWALFGKLRRLFIPTSGHTVGRPFLASRAKLGHFIT